MPPMSRPEGIPVGQLGQVRSITPRAEDSGIGTILQKTAQMSFGAAQTEAETAAKEAAFGLAHTQAGLELLKPMKRIASNEESLQAQHIANTAKLSLRRSIDALQSSGTAPAQWHPIFTKEYTKVEGAALTAASGVSKAAAEHVAKELQGEHLSLMTGLSKAYWGKSLDIQADMLQFQEEFDLQSAIAARDPAERLAHQNSYFTALERAAFNGAITPIVAMQKQKAFSKRLLEESTVQDGIELGLPATFKKIETYNILPSEKDALRDKATDAVSYKLKEQEHIEKVGEKQLKLDQAATFTTLRGQLLTESNPNTVLLLIHKTPQMIKNGVLSGEMGDQLIGHAESRIKDLGRIDPERDVPEIVDNIRYLIATAPESVTPKMLFGTRGISSSTRGQLETLLHSRQAEGHYSHLPSFKSSVSILKSLDAPNRDPLAIPGQQKGPGMGELVARAIVSYEREVEGLAEKLKRKPTNSDIRELDGYVEQLVKGIKSQTYSAIGGPSLKSFTK